MGDASSLRSPVLWLLLLSLPAILAAPSAFVRLRIEGECRTIFEGWIITTGHNVSTASGGEHHCDGTNHGAHPHPGPTPTSALDDAARLHNFTWDGTYFDGFDDYFITRIANIEGNGTQQWSILVGYIPIKAGGCQVQVRNNDNILFAFDAVRMDIPFLKLSGPEEVVSNKPFRLTVIDGRTGAPVPGAVVTPTGATTDEDGHVTLNVTNAGEYRFKAEKPSSIRSNSVYTRVVNSQPVRVDSEK